MCTLQWAIFMQAKYINWGKVSIIHIIRHNTLCRITINRDQHKANMLTFMPVLGYMRYLFIISLHIIRHVGTFKSTNEFWPLDQLWTCLNLHVAIVNHKDHSFVKCQNRGWNEEVIRGQSEDSLIFLSAHIGHVICIHNRTKWCLYFEYLVQSHYHMYFCGDY